MITQTRLKELLHYSPETGIFTWLRDQGRVKKGSIAGAVDYYGYIVIRLDRVLYKAHRLAWLYVHGEWPDKNIDHINRQRNDNRLKNLRDVDQSVNGHNGKMKATNTSGFTGVTWRKDRGKWSARIKVGYKNIDLGLYANINDAVEARQVAEAKLLASLAGK